MTAYKTLSLLKRYESRNVTYQDPERDWPIVWERAKGVRVWDTDGRAYLDFTAAFGVAAAGHANPRVVRAGQRQMDTLLHAMGDVHPHVPKANLARELSRLTYERWRQSGSRRGKVVFCNSGFEAVEAGLKTARLATGRSGIIAFEGGYHGLGYGALNVTHRKHFRGPFENQLKRFGHFLPFPAGGGATRRGRRVANETVAKRQFSRSASALFRQHRIGAILVEPVQARGGIHVPPPWFLPTLRRLCDQNGALLIVDEIYTGFGRTGKWFACEHSGVVPDVICLGKALTGGFPLSACVGRDDLMDEAWPESTGEAIHTSTFLGHPVGCAMAIAHLSEIKRLKLVHRSARLGALLLKRLEDLAVDVEGHKCFARGLGLMAGLELRRPGDEPATAESLAIVKRMLHRGFILLPEGHAGEVISFTPPLTVTEPQINRMMRALRQELAAVSPFVL